MIYESLTAALATQHGKERVIAPALSALTGLSLEVPAGIDTDALGTFTGEMPRAGTMRETARRKAHLGMEATGLPLGMASEGGFGPHPFMPFLAVGREVLMFIDDMRGIEIVEEVVSKATNFAALDLTPTADVGDFLNRVGFPAHALVLRSGEAITKGINSSLQLERLLKTAPSGARLETDMRAHVNPTRMAEIGKLAQKLAHRIATPCPACGAPGFGVVRSDPGLPCEDCKTPTPLIRSLVSACALCSHEHHAPRTDGRAATSPAECPECNP